MRNYLYNAMNKNENGLFMLQLPTGNGKTYESVNAIVDYVNNIKDGRKTIYLTTLNKNLPENEFKKAFDNNEWYEKNVLWLRSNSDEVVDKILDLEIPERMKSDSYIELYKAVTEYKNATNKKIYDKGYLNDLFEKVSQKEYSFRKFIYSSLRKEFATPTLRKQAIKNDKDYRWIGQLYSAVFTDEYKVIMMSVSKFMKRNSIVYDRSYSFLNSNLIDNSIIFIDEFDATKDTIQNEIITNAIRHCEDYIMLFRCICNSLNFRKNINSFTVNLQKAMKEIENKGGKYTYSSIVNEANKIYKDYSLNLSIKIKESVIDNSQSFLFNDGSFHTVLRNPAKYVRASVNKTDGKIDIFFENKSDFYENRSTDNDISIYSLLRDINSFLYHFKLLVMNWANNYMNIVNSSRDEISDAMSVENAISSVLDCLILSDDQRLFLMNDSLFFTKNKDRFTITENNFYAKGMEYYGFEDSDSHNENTILRYVKINDTPEKIILNLAEKATVFGISATAEINTVVGNYNLEYLKEKLGDTYHSTPNSLKEKVMNVLNKRWTAYYDGRITIHSQIVDNETQGLEPTDYCKKFMNIELAKYAVNFITNTTTNDYAIRRYCNIFKVMSDFNNKEDMQSLLYLGMALPKSNNAIMDSELVTKLFDYSKKMSKKATKSSIYFLNSENYDESKELLQDRLADGEKIFVMSSYNTIGAGQNLQYQVPNDKKVVYLEKYDENDNRFMYKDFDALYLGDVTNMTVNTYDGRITVENLIKMLFQIEELYENGEINWNEKDRMIKLAFRTYSGSSESIRNLLYQQKSIIMQSNRIVLQAVGRMCRTFVKSSNLYLYIDSKLLSNLYAGELNKNILPPEMKTLVSLKEKLGVEYSDEKIKILNIAEKKSTDSLRFIRSTLSQNWTSESMKLWQIMRTLVLKYPTANSFVYNDNKFVKDFYITSGEKLDSYIYSQYSDFSDVTLDFSNDKIAFKNSNRAKIKGNTNELAIYEMNEKNSGLPEILKYPEMYSYFINQGYAVGFSKNDYIMSPVLYHNIYKGALGEVAGKFILERELGIELQPIDNPEYFEFFDYKLANDVYIDFKNWKFTYVQDKNEIRQAIIAKMDYIGAKRVYVINIVSNKDYKPNSMIGDRLIEIPKLLNSDGTVCYNNLGMICREDIENANK